MGTANASTGVSTSKADKNSFKKRVIFRQGVNGYFVVDLSLSYTSNPCQT